MLNIVLSLDIHQCFPANGFVPNNLNGSDPKQEYKIEKSSWMANKLYNRIATPPPPPPPPEDPALCITELLKTVFSQS